MIQILDDKTLSYHLQMWIIQNTWIPSFVNTHFETLKNLSEEDRTRFISNNLDFKMLCQDLLEKDLLFSKKEDRPPNRRMSRARRARSRCCVLPSETAEYNSSLGFSTTSGNSDHFRDLRLKHFPNSRENLWSHDSHNPEENTHMRYEDKLFSIKHGKFLPKSRFSDRRLKWSNRGKRYNLHAH